MNVQAPPHRRTGRSRPALRRRLTIVTLVATLVIGALAALGAGQGVASAQTAPTPAPAAPTSTAPVPLPSPEIIPEPNSGHAPRDAGERGGSQQTLLFLLVCAALAVLVGLIWRDSRRKLAAARARGDLPAPSTTPPGSAPSVAARP